MVMKGNVATSRLSHHGSYLVSGHEVLLGGQCLILSLGPLQLSAVVSPCSVWRCGCSATIILVPSHVCRLADVYIVPYFPALLPSSLCLQQLLHWMEELPPHSVTGCC